MLNTAISIFDIFPYNGYVDWYTSFAKDSIYTMQGLEHSFVGISVPGFAGCYVYAFTPLPLGVSIGPLNKIPSVSILRCASGVMPLL